LPHEKAIAVKTCFDRIAFLLFGYQELLQGCIVHIFTQENITSHTALTRQEIKSENHQTEVMKE
jgi:hypothetical protein